jgi:hypothetical protein
LYILLVIQALLSYKLADSALKSCGAFRVLSPKSAASYEGLEDHGDRIRTNISISQTVPGQVHVFNTIDLESGGTEGDCAGTMCCSVLLVGIRKHACIPV